MKVVRFWDNCLGPQAILELEKMTIQLNKCFFPGLTVKGPL